MDSRTPKSSIAYPLSDSEVSQLLDGKTHVVVYPDLSQISDIDELLEPHGSCVILIEFKKDYGHWTCLIKRGEDSIEWFDSYGAKPDSELKQIPLSFRIKSNQNHTQIIRLLLGSGKKIQYNQYRLQKLKNGINTCGRHCVVRILMKDYNIDKYAKMLRADPDMNPDQVVTEVTNQIMGW